MKFVLIALLAAVASPIKVEQAEAIESATQPVLDDYVEVDAEAEEQLDVAAGKYPTVAQEGQKGYCIGKVWYGAHGRSKFVGKVMKGKFRCNNAVFGDPDPGYKKHCGCNGARKVAREGETGFCKGVVSYGAAGRYHNLRVGGRFECTN